MSDGRSHTEQIDAWLKEGLRLYSEGHPLAALETWYRILNIDVGHALAQQYVAYVRQVYRVDTAPAPPPPPDAPPGLASAARADVGDLPTADGAPGGLPPRLASVARADVDDSPTADGAPRVAPGGQRSVPVAAQGTDGFEVKKLLGYDAASSWSDLVDSSFDVIVPIAAPRPPPAAPPPPTIATETREVAQATLVAPAPPAASLAQVTSAASEDDYTQLMRKAHELLELGDLPGSLDLIEKVLKIYPNDESALAHLQRNELALIKMYESKLGNMKRTPTQVMPPDEIMWTRMHHKAGFLLSQVDGMLTYEDLLEVSGMSRFDTMRILHDLVEQGIIG